MKTVVCPGVDGVRSCSVADVLVEGSVLMEVLNGRGRLQSPEREVHGWPVERLPENWQRRPARLPAGSKLD